MGFSRQEYWSEFPFPSPGDLPDSGFELRSPAQQADSLLSEPPGNAKYIQTYQIYSSVNLVFLNFVLSYGELTIH